MVEMLGFGLDDAGGTPALRKSGVGGDAGAETMMVGYLSWGLTVQAGRLRYARAAWAGGRTCEAAG